MKKWKNLFIYKYNFITAHLLEQSKIILSSKTQYSSTHSCLCFSSDFAFEHHFKRVSLLPSFQHHLLISLDGFYTAK